MERLEKDKTGGRQTDQEMLAVILVRGGRGLEMEISEWIPEIFKGVIVRLDWKWGTNKGEEVENDTHISASSLAELEIIASSFMTDLSI